MKESVKNSWEYLNADKEESPDTILLPYKLDATNKTGTTHFKTLIDYIVIDLSLEYQSTKPMVIQQSPEPMAVQQNKPLRAIQQNKSLSHNSYNRNKASG